MTDSDDSVAPDVTTHGPGDPEVAVVGGVHGDEPAGAHAVEALRDADLEFRTGVKLVVANRPALDADERYLDVDMNRTFPGDADSDAREERLAAELLDELDGLPVLSLHTTHSQPDPIALVDRDHPQALKAAAELPVPYVVDQHDAADGSLPSCHPTVTVEAGRQHTKDAMHTAKRLAQAYLRLSGALAADEPLPDSDPDYFRMTEAVGKPPVEDWELHVDNFERVSADTPYASTESDYLVSIHPFYPVLMSEHGYEDKFGYKAEFVAETYESARRELCGEDATVSEESGLSR